MKIQIGCANSPIEGWVNIDVLPGPTVDVVCDVTAGPLPFNEHSATEIYLRHVLEHIPLDKVRFCLSDWRRVLVPRGVLRIVTPDFGYLAREAMRDALEIELREPADHRYPLEPFQHYEDMMANIYRDDSYGVHKWDRHYWGYTTPYLRELLRRVGFRETRLMPDQVDSEVRVEAIK